MSKARNLARLIVDTNGDVDATALDAVTPALISDKSNTSTGAFDFPTGTTAERPSSPSAGYTRYNTTLEQLEMYDGSGWQTVKSYFSATGGAITDVAGYRIHTFTSSGTFQVTKGTKQIEYLIVAGGGASGTAHTGGAGGGAGGYLTGVLTVTVGSNSIVVGAGGSAPAAGPDTRGGNGVNSSALGFTAIGGGGGGAWNDSGSGNSGGSGGGAEQPGSPGSGTSGQGNAGGYGQTAPAYGAGGGGGANAVGQNGTTGAGGNGGDGKADTWTGSTRYLAGGGGGGVYTQSYSNGAGGLGGGGGSATTSGVAGAANTGGGGGGNRGTNTSPAQYAGGNGGSGIIVIRYAL